MCCEILETFPFIYPMVCFFVMGAGEAKPSGQNSTFG
jgi:hypothetical protein